MIVYFVVILSLLAAQVGAVLPTLCASTAKSIMFMFTTFNSLDLLRDAVGASRFAFGLPKLPAMLVDGKLKSATISRFTSTIVTHKVWAEVRTDPSCAHPLPNISSQLLAERACGTSLQACSCGTCLRKITCLRSRVAVLKQHA